jgi:hypothetical protein
MSTRLELSKLARVRLRDAEVLYSNQRYSGAFYLCGYVLELALKARICKTLRWPKYNVGSSYSSFKTHDLDVLLNLAGLASKIQKKYVAEWLIVKSWKPERRYEPAKKVTRKNASAMLRHTRTLLKVV